MHDSLSTFLVVGLAPTFQPQRRQRTEQLPLADQPFGRHHADLRVHRGVDLASPRRGTRVESRHPLGPRILLQGERDQQVVLGIPNQVLHDPLRLRVRVVAEVGTER